MMRKFDINKSYLLTAGAMVLLILAYQFAFRRTLESWHLHNELQRKITASTGFASQPAYLERKNRNLDHILKGYKADTVNFRSNILENITAIALHENVQLAEVPLEDASFHNGGNITEKIRFEGDYFALLRTLKILQATQGVGVVRSVAIKKNTKELQNKDQEKLSMDIYFNIMSN
jgi:hypothetical protein